MQKPFIYIDIDTGEYGPAESIRFVDLEDAFPSLSPMDRALYLDAMSKQERIDLAISIYGKEPEW